MSDPYLDNLTYHGAGGVIITLSYQARVRDRFGRVRIRQASRWWFTRPGWIRTRCGPFKSKFDALLAAAHASRMSGQRCNLIPVKEKP